MKIIRTIYLATILLLVDFSYAGPQNMPPPTAKGAEVNTTNADDTPPIEGGSPIDQNLVFLMIAGLTLGAVSVYKNKIKKASV